jgi:hypothetical protein
VSHENNRITCPGARKVTSHALKSAMACAIEKLRMRAHVHDARGFHTLHELTGELTIRSGQFIDAVARGESESELVDRLAHLTAATLVAGAALRVGLGCEPRT